MNPKSSWGTTLADLQFGDVLRFRFDHLRGDFTGGLTSAVVALPLALGFGLLAYGGDPRGAVAGLYGAIFTGFFAALFGGTPRQITGPTGGMTVILTTVYKEFGVVDALLGACVIAGLLQVLYGFIRAGRFISFIPYPVIVGFTNGIAILIFTQQLTAVAGAPVIAAITIAAIALTPIVSRAVPRALVGLLVGTAAAALLAGNLPWIRTAISLSTRDFSIPDTLQTIGEIPRSFALPSLPAMEWRTWSRLLPAGITISLLGALESLLASVVADSVTGDRHNSDRELIGQGIGNIVAPLFGGIAGTGAIVRTNVNIRGGGTTKLSGMIHSIVLVGMMLALAPLVARIPLAVLGGLLVMTAVGMFEWEPLRLLPKTPLPDAVVMTATMLITVVADLITAVLAGFALAGFLFVYRMSELGMTNLLDERHRKRLPPEEEVLLRSHRIVAFDVEGPLFFGAVKSFVREIEQQFDYRVIIINMQDVPIIDATGALALEDVVDRLNRDRKQVVFAGMRPEVRAVLHRLGVTEKIGVGRFARDMEHATRYAVRLATGQAEKIRLGDYLSPDLILLDVRARSKRDLFSRMVARGARHGRIRNRQAFFADLWEREESESTGLEHGVAIPHARSGASDRLVMLVARLAAPVPYETMDRQPVSLVFLIASPDDDDQYLRALSLLSRTLRKPGLLGRLNAAIRPEEVFDILAHQFDLEQ